MRTQCHVVAACVLAWSCNYAVAATAGPSLPPLGDFAREGQRAMPWIPLTPWARAREPLSLRLVRPPDKPSATMGQIADCALKTEDDGNLLVHDPPPPSPLVAKLLKSLSLKQKVGQMTQLSAGVLIGKD
eukprot:SAG31_NODE_20782_length_565_cov_1.225322_1_plen_129_part_10